MTKYTSTAVAQFFVDCGISSRAWNLPFAVEFPCLHGIMRNMINEEWLMQDLKKSFVFSNLASYLLCPSKKHCTSERFILTWLQKRAIWWCCHTFQCAAQYRYTLPKLCSITKGLRHPASSHCGYRCSFPSIVQVLWPAYMQYSTCQSTVYEPNLILLTVKWFEADDSD